MIDYDKLGFLYGMQDALYNLDLTGGTTRNQDVLLFNRHNLYQ